MDIMRKTVYVVIDSNDYRPWVYTDIKHAINAVACSLKGYAKHWKFSPEELKEALDDFYDQVHQEADYCGSYLGEYSVGFHVTDIQD